MISMKNVQYIQCEDIEVLRVSNTKSSMLYNLATVAEILGDPYSKKSPLPSIGRLAVSPNTSSYQVLGQPRILQRHITRSNHPRIHAQ